MISRLDFAIIDSEVKKVIEDTLNDLKALNHLQKNGFNYVWIRDNKQYNRFNFENKYFSQSLAVCENKVLIEQNNRYLEI